MDYIKCGWATIKLYGSILKLAHSMGRLNDVLVLSSGEKTVPGPIEGVVRACRYVAVVCTFGCDRNQVGILVGPKP